MQGEEGGEGEACRQVRRLINATDRTKAQQYEPSSPICLVLGTLGGCGAAAFACPLVFSDLDPRVAGTGRAAKSLEPSSGLDGFDDEYRRCWRPVGL